jgi:hypothetical protein
VVGYLNQELAVKHVRLPGRPTVRLVKKPKKEKKRKKIFTTTPTGRELR